MTPKFIRNLVAKELIYGGLKSGLLVHGTSEYFLTSVSLRKTSSDIEVSASCEPLFDHTGYLEMHLYKDLLYQDGGVSRRRSVARDGRSFDEIELGNAVAECIEEFREWYQYIATPEGVIEHTIDILGSDPANYPSDLYSSRCGYSSALLGNFDNAKMYLETSLEKIRQHESEFGIDEAARQTSFDYYNVCTVLEMLDSNPCMVVDFLRGRASAARRIIECQLIR